MTMLRRRGLIMGLVALPTALFLSGAVTGRTDWAARLQRDLDAAAARAPGTAFLVKRVDLDISGGVALAAVVEMHWTPGLRRRKITAVAGTSGKAYDALLMVAIARFSTANRAISG